MITALGEQLQAALNEDQRKALDDYKNKNNLSEEEAENIKTMLDVCRKYVAAKLAEEIIGVQPMSENAFKGVSENSMSEKVLIEEGYEPVSSDTRLTWIKKQ